MERKMLRKFRAGSHVMVKPAGIPMTVTMYADKHLGEDAIKNGEAMVCVTWQTLEGKVRTARFKENILLPFPLTEWNGRPL